MLSDWLRLTKRMWPHRAMYRGKPVPAESQRTQRRNEAQRAQLLWMRSLSDNIIELDHLTVYFCKQTPGNNAESHHFQFFHSERTVRARQCSAQMTPDNQKTESHFITMMGNLFIYFQKFKGLGSCCKSLFPIPMCCWCCSPLRSWGGWRQWVELGLDTP